MKKFKFLITSVTIAAVMTACSDDNTPNHWVDPDVPSIKDVNLSRSEQEVRNSINEFGFDLIHAISENYETIFDDNTDGNISISPLSAALSLAMVANSCGDNDATLIENALHCSDLDALNSLSNKLIRILSHKQDITVMLANSIWYDNSQEIYPEFSRSIFDTFYAQVNQADLYHDATMDLINGWVSTKTNGLINNIINQTRISSPIIWANAMYAQREWADTFDKNDTKKANFHGRDRNSAVDMMSSSSTFDVFTTDQYNALRLPFKGHNASMVFVLPSEDISAEQLFESFSSEEFSHMTQSWTPCEIPVKLPKFDIAMEINLDTAFESLGIPSELYITAFTSPDTYPFSIRQVTRTTIDEQGAKAAATTIIDGFIAPMPPKALTFDRPFLYFFCDETTGTILMAGRICNL